MAIADGRGWMRRRGSSVLAALLLVASLVAMSCAPAQAPGGVVSNNQPGSQVARTKVVQIGMVSSREPNAGIALGSGGIGGLEHNFTFHAGLTAYDAQGALTPRVAAKVPSVADGDYDFRAVATDKAGNSRTAVVAARTIDNSAPQTTITSGPSGIVTSVAASFSFSAKGPVAVQPK